MVAELRNWPGTLVEKPPQPGDVAPEWAEHIQGAAYSGGYWFLAQIDRLWRIPVDTDLSRATENDPGITSVGIPERGIDHLGDCDVYDDLVYVAMEGTDPSRIGLFDLDLHYRGSAPLIGDRAGCAWCAVDPRDSTLYMSAFDTDHLSAYQPTLTVTGLRLDHKGDVPLRTEDGSPLCVNRVQGGTFSRHGHLYLSSDCPEGGILGVDVATGRRGLHVPIDYEPGWPQKDIIEGLTIADLSQGQVPWMSGVIHVLMFDAHSSRPDYVWFRHYDVADDDDRQLF
jgi:hypothetical protein